MHVRFSLCKHPQERYRQQDRSSLIYRQQCMPLGRSCYSLISGKKNNFQSLMSFVLHMIYYLWYRGNQKVYRRKRIVSSHA